MGINDALIALSDPTRVSLGLLFIITGVTRIASHRPPKV